MSKALEKQAWNCNEWPRELSDQVEECMEVSDESDMSTEQVVAYAILMERERCAGIVERRLNPFDPDWIKALLEYLAGMIRK